MVVVQLICGNNIYKPIDKHPEWRLPLRKFSADVNHDVFDYAPEPVHTIVDPSLWFP